MNSVLYINEQGNIGGAENSLMLLVRSFKNRFDITVACPNKSRLCHRVESEGVKVLRIYAGKKSCSAALNNLRILWFVIRNRIGIVHINNISSIRMCILVMILNQTKIVLHVRDNIRRKRVVKFLSRFCDVIIAVSGHVGRQLERLNIRKEKIAIVYNGIEIKDRTYEKEKCGKFVFANVGQFVGWKRQDVFIKAAKIVLNEVEDAKFRLVGDDVSGGNYKYKKRILEMSKGSAVKWLGWVDMDEMWKSIDCLVHCARDEPFGRVLIEAMTKKVLVIAEDSGGCTEIIRNSKTGYLYQREDIEGLAELMIKAVKKKESNETIIDDAFEDVRRFDHRFTEKETLNVYHSLAKDEDEDSIYSRAISVLE